MGEKCYLFCRNRGQSRSSASWCRAQLAWAFPALDQACKSCYSLGLLFWSARRENWRGATIQRLKTWNRNEIKRTVRPDLVHTQWNDCRTRKCIKGDGRIAIRFQPNAYSCFLTIPQEHSPPCVDDFLYICDDAYKREELISMEESILQTLSFDINIPIPYRFLRRYAKVCMTRRGYSTTDCSSLFVFVWLDLRSHLTRMFVVAVSAVRERQHGHADSGSLLLRDESHGDGPCSRERLVGGLGLPADGAGHQRPGRMGRLPPYCSLSCLH